MQRFPMAHASGADWRELCADCLDQLGGLPGTANLGFLYVTSPLVADLDELLIELRQATGITHWVGSAALGISCTGQEYYDTAAMVLMVGEFPTDAFRLLPNLYSSLEPLTDTCRSWYRQHRYHTGILHADPRNPSFNSLFTQLIHEVPGVRFVGGFSSAGEGGYCQVADTCAEGSVSGVLFGPGVRLTSGLTQGCSPLGPRHRITGCERNIIRELDERPALAVLYEDIGEILARDPRRIAGFIFAGLSSGEDDDYRVRNLLGLDLRHQLIAIGEPVRTGQRLLFCRRDGNSARNDLVRMVRELRRQLPGAARGGLYYSCVGRGRHLFGEHSQELRLIRAELGDIPLVGFFANGEISNNRLYGYTGVLTLFS